MRQPACNMGPSLCEHFSCKAELEFTHQTNSQSAYRATIG